MLSGSTSGRSAWPSNIPSDKFRAEEGAASEATHTSQEALNTVLCDSFDDAKDADRRIRWERLQHPRLAPAEWVMDSADLGSVADLIGLAEQARPVPPLLVMTLLVQAFEAWCVLAEHDLEPSGCEPHQLKLHRVDPEELLADPSRDPHLRLDIGLDIDIAPRGTQRGEGLRDLGTIAARLLVMKPGMGRRRHLVREWFRKSKRVLSANIEAERLEVVRFVERLCDSAWQRPALHLHQEARALAMTLFAADYQRRRARQIEVDLEDAQSEGDEDRVMSLLEEARSFQLRSPRLGLAAIWLSERRLDAEERSARTFFRRRSRRRHVGWMFAKNSWLQVWLTAFPLALAILLSGLIGLILVFHILQNPAT